jgi:hypothetical protein
MYVLVAANTLWLCSKIAGYKEQQDSDYNNRNNHIPLFWFSHAKLLPAVLKKIFCCFARWEQNAVMFKSLHFSLIRWN